MRNRIRRQMKAAVSQFTGRIASGFNVIFIPRKSDSYLYTDVLDSVEKLLTKAELLK